MTISPDSGRTVEETTILGLSEELLKALDDLQARLNNRFHRSPKEEATGKDRACEPNVLDEIIVNLRKGNNQLFTITGFISNKVLPKIS